MHFFEWRKDDILRINKIIEKIKKQLFSARHNISYHPTTNLKIGLGMEVIMIF